MDRDAHHDVARRAAAAGTILLSNSGVLPLRADQHIAVIGAFATEPRYQGAGSSQVNPTKLDRALDELRARLGDAGRITYSQGYDGRRREVVPRHCWTRPSLLLGRRMWSSFSLVFPQQRNPRVSTARPSTFRQARSSSSRLLPP